MLNNIAYFCDNYTICRLKLEKNISRKFLKILSEESKFIITSHERPDADAVSSMVSLEYLLNILGKEVLCLSSDVPDDKFSFIDDRKRIVYIDDHKTDSIDLSEFVLIVLDTNDIKNTGRIEKEISPFVKTVFFIDHHSYKLSNENKYFIRVSASSTCEIIYSIYKHFKVAIPKEIGDALYSGIISDTGSFHYPKTSSYTFKIASELVKNGTDPNSIYLLLFERNSLSSLRIHSLVLQTLDIVDESFAFMEISREMLMTSGASDEESESLINIPLLSLGIVASVIFKERSDGVKKVSMRSKGTIDVASFALSYGGGGHRNAAGFKLKNSDSFDQVKKALIEFLRTYK